MVEIKRKYRKFEKLLRDFLNRSKKNLLKDGVRSYIAKSVSKDFEILKSECVGKDIEANEEFAIFMRKYFERKI